METIRDAGPKLKSFYYHVCKPSDPSLVRGCVVVLHGAECHGARYESFGNELAKNGYVMLAIDHIGHGKTILDEKDDLGKWEKKDFYYSAYNAYYLVDAVKKMYPNKPIYLLGDDYGGTMVQYMMGKFDNIFDGIIISSCGMPTIKDKMIFAKCWVKKVLFYDGSKSKGTFKSRTRFLNFHYKPARTKYDWLNSDPAEVDRFIEDPLAGFVGTVGYYYYQYKYIVSTPVINRLKKANRKMPILMIGGGEDCITHYGKQIFKLRDYYCGKGFSNVETIIYRDSRHDVLLDREKATVARDIAEWIDRNSYKEERFETKKKNEVVEVKTFTLGDMSSTVINTVAEEPKVIDVFVEEEPDDDLKLSTEIKKD